MGLKKIFAPAGRAAHAPDVGPEIRDNGKPSACTNLHPLF